MDYEYKQGDLVFFHIAPVHGTGKVCGVSNTGVPGLGVGYIVEILNIGSTDGASINYPYTHMVVFESQMSELIDVVDRPVLNPV